MITRVSHHFPDEPEIRVLFLLVIFATSRALPGQTYIAEYSGAAIHAAEGRDWKLVEHLVESGADPNTVLSDSHSLLSYACMTGYFDYRIRCSTERMKHVKFLVSKGANVNLADSFGVVPLLVADRRGSEELIAFLKKSGAVSLDYENPRIKNCRHSFGCGVFA